MKIKGRRTNFRVIVEPRGLGDFGSIRTSDDFIYGRGKEADERKANAYMDRCKEIAAQVKRHVYDVYSAYVEFDTEHVCEHCGGDWTEASSTYNGGCCDADEANNPEAA